MWKFAASVSANVNKLIYVTVEEAWGSEATGLLRRLPAGRVVATPIYRLSARLSSGGREKELAWLNERVTLTTSFDFAQASWQQPTLYYFDPTAIAGLLLGTLLLGVPTRSWIVPVLGGAFTAHVGAALGGRPGFHGRVGTETDPTPGWVINDTPLKERILLSRQNFSSISVRALVWALIALL